MRDEVTPRNRDRNILDGHLLVAAFAPFLRSLGFPGKRNHIHLPSSPTRRAATVGALARHCLARFAAPVHRLAAHAQSDRSVLI